MLSSTNIKPAARVCEKTVAAGVVMIDDILVFVLLLLAQEIANLGEEQLLFGWFGCGSRSGFGLGVLLAAEIVDELDSHKDTEGHDEEVDNSLYPSTPIHGNFGLYDFLSVEDGLLDNELVVGEVHAAGHDSDQRHDDVVDQRRDDLSESGTDDYADSHVDDVTLHGEFLEFGNKLSHMKR